MTPALVGRAVRVSYSGRVVLDLPTVAIDGSGGVRHLVMGPNGAGKSTLLDALTGYARLERPGEVRLGDGRRISGRRPATIARMGVARTFQTPPRFAPLLVWEVLSLAALFGSWTWMTTTKVAAWKRTSSRAMVDPLLEELGLGRAGDVPVHRLEEELLIRVELGRCLAMRPRLLLLDEPSAGLDASHRDWLVSFLGGQFADVEAAWSAPSGLGRISVVVVTHDLVLARTLGAAPSSGPISVWVLDQGQLIAEGTMDEVLQDSRVREVYLGPGVVDAGSR